MLLAPGLVLLIVLLVVCGAVGVLTAVRRDRREERDALAEGRIRELEDRLRQLEDVVLAMGAEVRQLDGEALAPPPASPEQERRRLAADAP